MLRFAEETYSMISGVSRLLFQLILFYKLWRSLKQQAHISGARKSSILCYFALFALNAVGHFACITINFLIALDLISESQTYDYQGNMERDITILG